MANWETLRSGRAAAQLRTLAQRGTMPHALLLTGSGDRMALARYAAAAMECTGGDGEKPCGVCPHCHKALADIHPDIITVTDPAHKNISVDVIRAVRSEAYIQPNEGRRKVYLFPDCSLLTEQDQNVLLKIVEEGPSYAAFFFCAENGSVVLQTLRSRCVEIKLTGAQAAEAPADTETVEALCRAVASGKRGTVTQLLVGLEKRRMTREELAALLEQAQAVFAEALLALYGCTDREKSGESGAFLGKNLTKMQMMRTIELLQKYRRECGYNVGTGHVLGALAVELEGIH